MVAMLICIKGDALTKKTTRVWVSRELADEAMRQKHEGRPQVRTAFVLREPRCQ